MKRNALKSFLLTAFILVLISATALASGYLKTTGRCNLRDEPKLSGDIITDIPKGTSLHYTKSSYDARGVKWFYVKYDGDHGWVSSNYTTLKDEDYEGYVQADSMPSSGYVTTTANVNLRASATNKAKIYRTIPDDTYLHFTAKSYDERGICWLKVRYGGRTGWISSRYTDKYGGWNAGHSGASGTVTAFGSANIRKKPSLKGAILDVLPDGESAKYLGSKEYDSRGVIWYKIRYAGVEGWVSSTYTDLD